MNELGTDFTTAPRQRVSVTRFNSAFYEAATDVQDERAPETLRMESESLIDARATTAAPVSPQENRSAACIV